MITTIINYIIIINFYRNYYYILLFNRCFRMCFYCFHGRLLDTLEIVEKKNETKYSVLSKLYTIIYIKKKKKTNKQL